MALAAIPLLRCAPAPASPDPPAVQRDCSVLCGTVVDTRTSKPIEQFKIGLFTKNPKFFPPMVRLPRGVPPSPGRPVEAKPIVMRGGKFEFDALSVSNVTVVVSAHGYQIWQLSDLALPWHTPLKIQLNRAWQVQGRVLTSGGMPVPGASISYDQPNVPIDEALAGIASSRLAQTDAAGRFVVDDVQTWQSDIAVIAGAPGFLPRRQTIPIRGPSTSAEIELEPAVAVGGVVLDQSGKPAQAWVAAQSSDTELRVVRASPDGRFRFDALPLTMVHFTASRQMMELPPTESAAATVALGYASDAAVDLRTTRDVHLTLAPSGMVRGTMKGLNGVAYGYGVDIRCQGWSTSIRAGSHGEFLAAVPAGDCNLTGAFTDSNSRFQTETAHIAVADGNDVPVELLFANPTEVRLTMNGAGLTGPLSIIPDGQSEPVARIYPENMAYRFAGIKPGRYEARFRIFEGEFQFPLEVGSQKEFSVDLRIAEPKLTLLGYGGKRTSGSIEIVGARYAEGQPEPVEPKVGPFLPFGDYELRIEKPGYLPQEVRLRVPGQEKIVTLEARPLPFSHPSVATPIAEDEREVLAAVLQHYVAETRDFREKELKEKPAALHLLDQTAAPRVSVGFVYGEEGSDIEKQFAKWSAAPGVGALKTTTGIRSLEALARSDIHLDRFDQLPLLAPEDRGRMTTEIEAVDPEAFYERFPDAAGLLALSRAAISGNDAYVSASLMGMGVNEELIHLRRVDGRWTVAGSIVLQSTPGC